MPTFINTQGQVVDATTGEVVGRAEGAPTEAETRTNKMDVPVEGSQKYNVFGFEPTLPKAPMELLRNLSWGFNSALFSLPDAAQRVIGKGLGLNDEQTFQFAKFFNRGEVAPQNSTQRYVRAIGEGVGGALPFTGILSAAAAARPLVTAAAPASGILRGVADDAIRMVQKSPALAANMDVAFGAAWEGLRQAVEENVSDDNPSKALYKELLPTAAFVGVPGAMALMGNRAQQLAGMLPSVKAAKFAKENLTGQKAIMSEIEKDVMQDLPSGWKLPLVRVIPKMLMKNAESKLTQVFGPIAESKEAQESLRLLENTMKDPRFADLFVFDTAERTMFAPVIKEEIALLSQLPPRQLGVVKERVNQNLTNLDNLFSNLAPEARKPLIEAFQAVQAERKVLFDDLATQMQNLTDAQKMAISERLGPQNIDMVNNELRGAMEANIESDFSMRKKVLSRAGFAQAMGPDGTIQSTREQGKSLFPSQDIEEAALSLIKKYKPERPSVQVQVPMPIRMLDNFVQSQMVQRERLESRTLNSLVDETVESQLSEMGRGGIDPEFIKTAKNSVRELLGLSKEKVAKGKSGKGYMGLSDYAQGANRVRQDSQGNVSIYVTPNTSIRVNPEQLRNDAARIAEANTKIDLNLPEALDYLDAARKFRHDSINNFNASLMKGGSTRSTDGQRILDKGTAVFKDIEKLVLDHTPRLKNGGNEVLKMMIDDYQNSYARSLPLLLTSTKRGGKEYYLPNEDLMRNIYKTADNVRQAANLLGPGAQMEDLMTKGAIDWLRSKNVVNKDGLVDPKMIRSVLDKNRNIVEALPKNIQAKLADEVTLADDYVKRLGELDQRKITYQDNELDRVLAKAVRPEADPRMILGDALKDPAIMRKLVDTMGNDPEKLAALRRSVWDIAHEGSTSGAPLKSFLDNNGKSLKVLYGGTGHLEDLTKLADIQRRVNAIAGVTGQIPAFESLDQTLKSTFGFGIQFGTTTMREALVGRISPETGLMALMLRMTGSMENKLYNRLFTRALEDPKFAKQITHISTPGDAAKVEKQLADIGITRSMLFPEESKAATAGRRGVQQFVGSKEQEMLGQPQPIPGMAGQPVVPRGTASQMLRSLPPAPPTTGVQFNPRMPTKPQVQQGAGAGQIPLMYPAMFPNDPISGLLQQRQAMTQPPQQ